MSLRHCVPRRGYRLFGEKGDLTAGSYIVVRSQIGLTQIF